MTTATENPKMQFYELRVSAVVDETHDTRSFAFEVPPELRPLFAYRAGQFFTFEIPWTSDLMLKRSYSLASCPDSDAAPMVAVKRVDDGRVSNWFNDKISVGDTIRVQPPAGRFVLVPEHETAPLVLFGGGSGITPMMSLVKSALRNTERQLRLVYANRDVSSIIFKDELIQLQARFPRRLEVIHHLDSETGFMDAATVAADIEGCEGADFYICGPGPFMDTVETTLVAAGVERKHLHIERFVSPIDPDRREASTPAETSAEAVTGAAAKVVMTMAGETHEFETQADETVLAAAFRNKIDAEYQCEEGYCGCCMAKLVEGEVDMALHEALTEGEIADGWILTCQAKCKSKSVVINYDETF